MLATLNADLAFPAASTIKVPLLLMALERVQSGALDLAGRRACVPKTAWAGPGCCTNSARAFSPAWKTC